MIPTCAKPISPVFIDLETRSPVDLRAEGGWRYASSEFTRLLTVSWIADGEECVWLPGAWEEDWAKMTDERCEHTGKCLADVHLEGVKVFLRDGGKMPEPLRALLGRPWAAHNAATFDSLVWKATTGTEPLEWIDTYPLALAAGLPGGLSAIGKRMMGEGKYAEGQSALKDAMKSQKPGMVPVYKQERVKRKDGSLGGWKNALDEAGEKIVVGEEWSNGTVEPENVPIGQQIMVARYNLQDVKLLQYLWGVLRTDVVLPAREQQVLKCHQAVNARGVRIDRPLVKELIALVDCGRGDAIRTIRELTGGELCSVKGGDKDLGKRDKVLGWLKSQGVDIGGSLAKQIVQRWIDTHRTADDGLTIDKPADMDVNAEHGDGAVVQTVTPQALARVVQVLELRASVMRITAGKLDSAMACASNDDRVRGLFVYWGAHTGRWAGRRIQVQNLPRAKEGVDTWEFARLFERTGKLDYDTVLGMLPTDTTLYGRLTGDDVASAMLRMVFLPDEGCGLADADLSNIEARVLAALAGEQWLMKSFWEFGDPYTSMAQRIFGPQSTWPQFPDPKKPGEFLSAKKHPYRQVGKVVVLGCGYQLGVESFALYAAGMGIDLAAVGTTPFECIMAFRRLHPNIAGEEREYNGHIYFRDGYWDRLNNAALDAVRYGGPISVGPVRFVMRKGHLHCILPSGRRIVYRSAKVVRRTRFGRDYDSVQYLHGRFGWVDLYGGKLAENIVQAVSRDFVAESLVRCEERGLPVCLHVHDQIAASTTDDRFGEFMECMTRCPDWMPDFPLDAEGAMSPRFAKSPPPGVKEKLWRNGMPV